MTSAESVKGLRAQVILRREHTLRQGRSGASVIKHLFPERSSRPYVRPYASVDVFNDRFHSLSPLLRREHLGRILMSSFDENISTFGVNRVLYSLMDFVRQKSLSYHYSPAQDYFDPATLPSKMKAAGWAEKDIARLGKLLQIRILLDECMREKSASVAQLNLEFELLGMEIKALEYKAPYPVVQERKKLRAVKDGERSEVLYNFFRGAQRDAHYGEVLEQAGITTDEQKRELALQILEVMYAQRDLVLPGTLGFDIRKVFDLTQHPLNLIQHTTAGYFGHLEDTSAFKPFIVPLLGTGESLGFSLLLHASGTPFSFINFNRRAMLTSTESKEVSAVKNKREQKRLIENGAFYRTLYHRDPTGLKTGLFVDACKFAEEDGRDPNEIMTRLMMKYTQLILRESDKTPMFKEAIDKMERAIQPLIAQSNGQPMIFYDQGLKGSFGGFLAALVESHYLRNNLPNILSTGNPRATAFLFSIDEDHPDVFPHFMEGRNPSTLIEDIPRICVYDCEASEDGIALSDPASNTLALIYYHSMLNLR